MRMSELVQSKIVRDLIRRALREDIGAGDVTTLALVPRRSRVTAVIVARRDCVMAGHGVAAAVFLQVDAGIRYRARVRDGQRAGPAAVVAEIRGPARGILTAERTALNFLQRLTGIATLTNRFVVAVQPRGTMILDTRKTTPGLRPLEKYAVTCGGGVNHRVGLFDRVLIKDNHRRRWAAPGGSAGLDAAVREARRRFPRLEVEVEVETEAEFDSALKARPEWILLDNMTPARLRHFVKRCGGRCRLEASGGVTLANVARIAATGVDAISIGALTHSAPAADLSLEISEEQAG